MLNDTVNGEIQNSNARRVMINKKKFKPAGIKNTPKVVAVEIRQEDKEKVRSLKTGSHVAIPTIVTNYKSNVQAINVADFLQAGEFVSIKAYDGNRKDMEKKKAKQEAAKVKEDRGSEK